MCSFKKLSNSIGNESVEINPFLYEYIDKEGEGMSEREISSMWEEKYIEDKAIITKKEFESSPEKERKSHNALPTAHFTQWLISFRNRKSMKFHF